MLKPIETRYKGYRFRSRLEARWAVFFDALGMKWEYEPEGFDLGPAGYYLPDFRVTCGGHVSWYEVKPEGVESDPKFEVFRAKIEAMSVGNTLDSAVLLRGDPMHFFMRDDGVRTRLEFPVCPRCGHFDGVSGGLMYSDPEDVGHYCYPCDCNKGSDPRFAGRETYMHKGTVMMRASTMYLMREKVRKACEAARGARFEHGENGGIR